MWPTLSDPLKEWPGYALRRASATFMARLASRLAPLDLRPSEATVLLVIGANPAVTQTEVGRILEIASANMAPLVARLAERALIRREPVDGRSQALTLSDPGRLLMEKVWRLMEQHETDLLSRIPEPLRVPFVDALRAVMMESSKDEKI
jgi:DNA-binding MarR family transcriptional regulator